MGKVKEELDAITMVIADISNIFTAAVNRIRAINMDGSFLGINKDPKGTYHVFFVTNDRDEATGVMQLVQGIKAKQGAGIAMSHGLKTGG